MTGTINLVHVPCLAAYFWLFRGYAKETQRVLSSDGGVCWKLVSDAASFRDPSMAHILVIDDSKLQRAYMRLVCKDAGHEVVEASDGGTGIKLAVETSSKPGLILLDLQMPDMSGQQVLGALSERGIRTPVIVLTADDPTPIQDECLALGAARAVKKLEDPATLISLINSVLTDTDPAQSDVRASR